jgi:excisionase family DNA binding protein
MFTVKQAAERLGVSESLVYALCANRMLRHVRVGIRRGRIQIPPDAVDEYLAGRTVEAGGTPTSAGLAFTHPRLPAGRRP